MRTASLPVETPGSAATRPSRAWSAGHGSAWALVGAAVVIHLTLCWTMRSFLTDDAWITVRYAENLADGEGFVWNPGGPRSEGFSNPLLVVLEALAHAVGWSAPDAARLLGVGSGGACVVLVFARGRHVVGEPAAAVAALLTGCSAPFAAWSVGGLETTLVALALTAGTLDVARRDGGNVWRAAACFALLPWLRPEGLAVVAAVVVLGELPAFLRAPTRRRGLARIVVLGGVPALSQALLEAVRLGVYGHLLPNSVLYKSGAGDGLAVLDRFLDQAWLPALTAGVGLVLLVRGRARLLAVPPLVYVLGSIGTLDSANGYSRFFMPVWPLVVLLAAVVVVYAAEAVARRAGVLGAAAVTALAGAVVLLHGPAGTGEVTASQERYTACPVGAREAAVEWLRRTPVGTSFAVSDAGLVPARAGRTAVDSFFLNEPLIQETGRLSPAQRADSVHERDPDVIVLSSRDAGRFVPMYPTEQAIHGHPDMAGYRLVHVAEGGGGSCRYNLFLFER